MHDPSFRLVGIVVLALSAAAAAQDERIDLEWVFSDEGRQATSLPKHAWIGNDLIALYDTRPPKNRRTIESYDPRSGRRRAMVDAPEVIAGMMSILEPEEAIEEPGWPTAFGPNGRWAVYEKSDDILLLDLQSSKVIGVATGDARESSPQFSPDGQWLAFVRDNDLYAWHLDRREEKRLTADGSDTRLNGTVSWVYWEELLNRSDRGYAWSPDSSSIAYLQTDETGVGEMHYVDFEPHLPRVIRQRHAKPGEANPRVRAGIVDIATGTTTWIDLGSYLFEYLARIQWLPDSTRLAVQTLNRPQTALDVFVADVESGEARHLFRETNEAWVNVHDDLVFLEDGERFLWRSERDGYSHLYLFDMTGKPIRQVTRGEWTLRPSGGLPGMSMAIAAVDEAGGQVYFTALEKASTERHLYRIGLDGRDLERLTQADGTHAIFFSPEGTRYVASHSSLEMPPVLALFDRDGTKQSVIAGNDSGVQERFDLLPWELFTISAKDGFEMPAMMLKPRHFDAEKSYPAVVYVYGGPSAPTVTDAWQGGSRGYYHQVLAERGAIVFYVDNRSAAGRSKTDANAIVRQLYGPVELDDLLDGIAWLKAQPFVDADRVGIWGWSGGGTMTLLALTRSTEFAAGVAVAPVTDWRYYDTIYTERYMKRPQDNAAGYEAASHVKRAADLHGRLLLVHGTYDDNVHPQNSWAFSDELIEAGTTFDMMIYPMRKHGISDDAARHHVYRTMFEFWQRNLGLGD